MGGMLYFLERPDRLLQDSNSGWGGSVNLLHEICRVVEGENSMAHAAIVRTCGPPCTEPTSFVGQLQVYSFDSQPSPEAASSLVKNMAALQPVLRIQHEMSVLKLPLRETDFGIELRRKIKVSLKEAKLRRRETTPAQGGYKDWVDSLKSELKLLKPSQSLSPKKRRDDKRRGSQD